MSAISGVGKDGAIHTAVSQSIQRPASAEPTSRARAADKLDLSGVSHPLKSLKGSDVRTEKVAAVRAQIEAGTYENDHRLNAAIDRLMEDLSM